MKAKEINNTKMIKAIMIQKKLILSQRVKKVKNRKFNNKFKKETKTKIRMIGTQSLLEKKEKNDKILIKI